MTEGPSGLPTRHGIGMNAYICNHMPSIEVLGYSEYGLSGVRALNQEMKRVYTCICNHMPNIKCLWLMVNAVHTSNQTSGSCKTDLITNFKMKISKSLDHD